MYQRAVVKKKKMYQRAVVKKTQKCITDRAVIKKNPIFQQQKVQCQEYIMQAILKIDFKHDIICGRF